MDTQTWDTASASWGPDTWTRDTGSALAPPPNSSPPAVPSASPLRAQRCQPEASHTNPHPTSRPPTPAPRNNP